MILVVDLTAGKLIDAPLHAQWQGQHQRALPTLHAQWHRRAYPTLHAQCHKQTGPTLHAQEHRQTGPTLHSLREYNTLLVTSACEKMKAYMHSDPQQKSDKTLNTTPTNI